MTTLSSRAASITIYGRSKYINNNTPDSKSTMSLAKALGKEPEQKKKGGDTNTPVAAPSEYTNEMGYEDEQPFTTKCETKEDVDCQDSALKAKNSREDAHKSSTGHEVSGVLREDNSSHQNR